MKLTKEREWIKSRLSEEKYLHSLGAEEAARELAQEFSVDPDKAAFTALIHDNAKDIPYEEALQIIKQNNFEIDEEIKTNTKIIHAHLGACLAQKELNINDEEILNAIRFHTTGRPNMSDLEKVIFLADKIEANTRDLDFRDKVLNTFRETGDINKAILLCVDATIRSLLDRKLVINKQTIDVWNSYIC